jgi:hypothetical protein
MDNSDVPKKEDSWIKLPRKVKTVASRAGFMGLGSLFTFLAPHISSLTDLATQATKFFDAISPWMNKILDFFKSLHLF